MPRKHMHASSDGFMQAHACSDLLPCSDIHFSQLKKIIYAIAKIEADRVQHEGPAGGEYTPLPGQEKVSEQKKWKSNRRAQLHALVLE